MNTRQPQPETAQETAERVGRRMFERDAAAQALGMRVTEIAPGSAVVTMRVRADMLNGHQTCHGGLLATLADTAFAYGCNSYNELTVASGFAMDLLAPAREGELLSARCVERSRGGRLGLYDVEVSNEQGALVALFRGQSYTARGKPAVPPEPGEGAP